MTTRAILWHWLMARCWVLKVRMRTASRNFFHFSGQTAKSSPWLRARQNGGNGLNLEEMLYVHFRVRSTARSVTIGLSPIQVKSGSWRWPWNHRFGAKYEKTPLLCVKSGVFWGKYLLKLARLQPSLSCPYAKLHIFRIKSGFFRGGNLRLRSSHYWDMRHLL